MRETIRRLVWGPLDERLLLALVAANPDLLPEIQGIAGQIGFFLSETAIRANTEPPRGVASEAD